jgi:hypothetical protein
MRNENELFTAYNNLWGAPAVEADDTVDPVIVAVAAVIGAEGAMRTAEQEFNDASIALSQSQKAIANNQDQDEVMALVELSMTAYDAQVLKETALARAQTFFDLLYEDVAMIERAREAVW